VGRSRLALNPVVVTLAAILALFFILPLTGLVIRAPWSSMTSVITSSTSLDALWLTLIASLATTALALVFGFPMAWILARADFYGKSLLRGLTTLPMVLPPVVGGIVLQRTHGNWNTLLYIMVASAFVSASCWLFLKPERDEDTQ